MSASSKHISCSCASSIVFGYTKWCILPESHEEPSAFSDPSPMVWNEAH